MEVKEEKRPIWGIDQHLHIIVLTLSLLNIIQLVPNFFDFLSLNNIFSTLISLLGLFSFWLIHKDKNGGELLIFIWSIAQLIIFINIPHYSIDLSQGFSFPIGTSFESSTNGLVVKEVSLSINILAGLLISASFFRLKNKNYYKKLHIITKNIENATNFSSNIQKVFLFGLDKKMLVLNTTTGSKTYAIQVEKEDMLDFSIPEKEFLLCEIDTVRIKEESFKPYEFKQIGNVKVATSN